MTSMTIHAHVFVTRPTIVSIECGSHLIEPYVYEIGESRCVDVFKVQPFEFPCLIMACLDERVYSILFTMDKIPLESRFYIDQEGRGARGKTLCMWVENATEWSIMIDAMERAPHLISFPLTQTQWNKQWTRFVLGLDTLDVEVPSQSVKIIEQDETRAKSSMSLKRAAVSVGIVMALGLLSRRK